MDLLLSCVASCLQSMLTSAQTMQSYPHWVFSIHCRENNNNSAIMSMVFSKVSPSNVKVDCSLVSMLRSALKHSNESFVTRQIGW